jgi:hypothetical protein
MLQFLRTYLPFSVYCCSHGQLLRATPFLPVDFAVESTSRCDQHLPRALGSVVYLLPAAPPAPHPIHINLSFLPPTLPKYTDHLGISGG